MPGTTFPAILTAAILAAGIGGAQAQAGSSKAPDMTAPPGEYNTMPPVTHHKKHKAPTATTAPATTPETKTPAPPDQTPTPPPDQTQAAPQASEPPPPPTPQNEPMPGQEPSPPPH